MSLAPCGGGHGGLDVVRVPDPDLVGFSAARRLSSVLDGASPCASTRDANDDAGPAHRQGQRPDGNVPDGMVRSQPGQM